MTVVRSLTWIAALCVWAVLAAACGDSDSTVAPPVTSEDAGRCAVAGAAEITVPDVVGEELSDAIEQIDGAGLSVIGTGTPAGDPASDTAVVRSQAPSAGEEVPRDACVGFRTDEPVQGVPRSS